MTVGFSNYYSLRNKNRMFENMSVGLGDDLGYTGVRLKQRFNAAGVAVASLDMAPIERFNAVVFFDYPSPLNFTFKRLVKSKIPIYLVLLESPTIRPDNWIIENHAPFKKVFTWNPTLVIRWDDKYVRIHMPHKIPEKKRYRASLADKFCCMIASQKYAAGPNELYTERVKAIRWFEQNHPGEFALYGQRWDQHCFDGKWSWLNRFIAQAYKHIPLPKSRSFPSWKGNIQSKRPILEQYKFSLCFENSTHPGYLTEKVLDAFFAGSVPVYLGNPAVLSIIPEEAFIDYRFFTDYESLYAYMRKMPREKYKRMRRAGYDFVHSDAIKPLGADAFIDILLKEVVR